MDDENVSQALSWPSGFRGGSDSGSGCDGADLLGTFQYSSYPSQHPHNNASTSSPAPHGVAGGPTSPFAFAPPPLPLPIPGNNLAAPRPMPMPMYLSDNNGGPYASKSMMQPSSYPYSSAPMPFRTYSNESAGNRASASPVSSLGRTPNLNLPSSLPGVSSPLSAPLNSPYQYNGGRQLGTHSQSPYNHNMPSPQPRPVYPYMQAAEMPRSLTYPSYAQPYPSTYAALANPSYPASGSMGALRHAESESNVGSVRPALGYSFANRLPLVDRPFKCDECVQSFNRNHDLKRHKRIHLAVKPFGCDKCGKTFSRKDALRRHWLVKGCRGEEGATAPILPMFPITSSRRQRAASPPTPPPPSSTSPRSAAQTNFPRSSVNTHTQALNRPLAPPPLESVPSRTPSVRSGNSQIIVTPNELATPVSLGRAEQMSNEIKLGEPVVIESSSNNVPGAYTSPPTDQSGYFDMGVKSSEPSLLNPPLPSPYQQGSSPYSRGFTSNAPAKDHSHHPYRRSNVASPHKLSPGSGPLLSPTGSTGHGYDQRTAVDAEGKPIFAVPFNPEAYPGSNQDGRKSDGGLSKDEAMSRQNSGGSDPSSATWQRWHRPSFPFPQPGGAVGTNYQYDQSSPIELSTTSYSQ